jgi:3-hydroxyacyl-CoA dehydrogenase/enoyl-CoA hydratase/3-hydroxybutyryl-CoA epimerase
VIGPKAIFGSNTSTLPITRLAESSQRPKFIGIHFFSPVEKMMLVEVIIGKKTGEGAGTALDFVRAIKKTPIVVNDSAASSPIAASAITCRRPLMLIEGVPPAMIENGRQAGRHAGRPALAQ